MLYDKIVQFCKENHIPLYSFEKRCGLGNATIRTSNPRIDSIQKVAKEMGVPIEKLLEESEKEET